MWGGDIRLYGKWLSGVQRLGTDHSMIVGSFLKSYAGSYSTGRLVSIIDLLGPIRIGHWVSGIWFHGVSFIPYILARWELTWEGIGFRIHGGSGDIRMVLDCL